MPATDKDADPLPAAVPQAALTDDEGHPCRLLPAEDAGRRPPSDGPVLTFEAPAAGFRFLRLDLPAATWGGSGSFKFQIPAAMVRPAAPVDRRSGPGGRPQTGSGR
jgi:hypothetical protein